ncbi:glycoside hydrolase family 16 protein [Antarcticibacterium sp. 1MA-6-2]|uniref:glycoside hydrolase family 16 protein n=1 Tax=Antarcticibacterium sp. 1MA-6-2 TaxID=2908210 RepID=UPI001F20578B|nr:glycoside hydrolase family 16 protein [Antarcticibacterium sp. 1MA-6-2]UJH90409.1 glycoside hydrolase family 16 protein [Antarcticibacterium sp. 1MA-6-2]
MKNNLNFFLIALGVFSGLFSCMGQKGASSWNLVWQDEFENTGAPNSENWEFSSRGNANWNCYCANNPGTTLVKDGKLHLRGIITTEADSTKYQTGCIQTKDNFSFKYGKVEVRARLDKGKGSWPAIWMMPQDPQYGGWPHSGEIDIMEHLNFDTIVYQTIHSTYVDVQHKKETPINFATAAFKEGEFNVFGLEWYPDRLDFFLNGEKTFTYPRIEGSTTEQWPFDQEFYIILDQALGVSWVGEIHDKDLPVEMIVDWVRVYQEN